MTSRPPSESYFELGFPELNPVSTLRSIAQLFGASKSRCGIYLLEFPERRFYIGQAVEVVRRFAQHRKNYEEITGFSFIPTRREHLDETERNLIRRAERLGLLILNTVHASNMTGDSDLDMVLSQEQQAEWLSGPAAFNESDNVSPIVLPTAQLERFAGQFQKLQEHPLCGPSLNLLRTYLHNCVPSPKRTEYSFWVASCLPATNRNTWPRLFGVSAGMMELFVLGHHKGASSDMWGFLTVASDAFSETFKDDQAIMAAFPSIEIARRHYRDAGQHQLTLHANDARSMKAILENCAVQRAAASLTLRVMRKRATIYSKFHCKQLVDFAILANG